MILEITLEGLPPINTADGLNRWSRQRMRKAWEGRVCAAVLMQLGRWPSKPLERARITITRRSTRQPDFENLTQGGKFLLDGLVKAGVLIDDSPAVIGQPDYRWENAARGNGSVSARVESLDERQDVEIGPRVAVQRDQSGRVDKAGGVG